MSTLADYPLEFEDVPQITRKGGKDSKMSKTTVTEAPKASKKYAKTRGEHAKDIVIAVLLTGILAFIAGVQFSSSNNARVDAAIEKLTPTAHAQTSK